MNIVLRHFLDDLTCVLQEEASSFARVCDTLRQSTSFIGFYPIVDLDLWPVYALNKTDAANVVNPAAQQEVYIMPLGGAHFFFQPNLERMLSAFYHDDLLPEEKYGFELNEIILLSHKDTSHSLSLDFADGVNVVYASVVLPGARTIHLFGIYENPSVCWSSVMERYAIPCDILIESGKGFGDWLKALPIYERLLDASYSHILPIFNFIGKYMFYPCYDGFTKLIRIIRHYNDENSTVYLTNWRTCDYPVKAIDCSDEG